LKDTLSDPTPPDTIPPDPLHGNGFRTPLRYYSSPEAEVRPIVPRGVAIGCGLVSATLLLVLFGGGALVAHVGLGRLMDPLLGRMTGELATMYTKDVTPQERKQLADEITRLRENIRSGKVSVASLDPVMSALREAVSDQRITAAEAEKLARQVHDLNAAPAPKPHKPEK
jgi:hypothetical protein